MIILPWLGLTMRLCGRRSWCRLHTVRNGSFDMASVSSGAGKGGRGPGGSWDELTAKGVGSEKLAYAREGGWG